MNETAVLTQLIDEIEAATDSDVDVRTIGGDQDVDPPEVIVDWTTQRIANANGHHTKGAVITDGSGNNTGIEHHTYWRMEADCIARSYSEAERNAMLNAVQGAFIPYERDASSFDSDTREWEVGTSGPRNNPVLEPDWYEAGTLIAFDYLKREDETGKDYVEEIQYDTQNVPTLSEGGGYGLNDYGSSN